jgi:hypothetical protein
VSELGAEIKSRGVPDDLAPMVFVFTGTGKVTNGSLEIFKLLPHEFVKAEELPTLAQRIKVCWLTPSQSIKAILLSNIITHHHVIG